MGEREYGQMVGSSLCEIVFWPHYGGVDMLVPHPEVVVPSEKGYNHQARVRGKEAHGLYDGLFRQTMAGYPVEFQEHCDRRGLEVIAVCEAVRPPVARLSSDYGDDTLVIRYEEFFPFEDGVPYGNGRAENFLASLCIKAPPSVVVANRLVRAIMTGYNICNQPAILTLNGRSWAEEWKREYTIDAKLG